MPLTLEERERRAYADGNTELAALLREAIDLECVTGAENCRRRNKVFRR